MQPSIECLACGRDFWTLEDLNRHRWREHGGDLDTGVAMHTNGRQSISALIPDDECPEPPRLDG